MSTIFESDMFDIVSIDLARWKVYNSRARAPFEKLQFIFVLADRFFHEFPISIQYFELDRETRREDKRGIFNLRIYLLTVFKFIVRLFCARGKFKNKLATPRVRRSASKSMKQLKFKARTAHPTGLANMERMRTRERKSPRLSLFLSTWNFGEISRSYSQLSARSFALSRREEIKRFVHPLND